MRSEYTTYASFTPEQREGVSLPPLDASQQQLDTFWKETAIIKDGSMPADIALNRNLTLLDTVLVEEIK